jgi:geranylgeranyl reductase family protein
MTRIAIIGAGPTGAHCAYYLAKEGYEVEIYEEHSTVGKPVQCTGLVTKSFEKIIPDTEDFLVNKLNKVIVHAPNGKTAEIKTEELVLDRTRLDQHLMKKAQKAGARLLTGHKAIKIKQDKENEKSEITFLNDKKTKTVDCDILIGADGPMSLTAESIGAQKQKFWFGAQALARMPVDKNTYHTYFGDSYPKFFGWNVPEAHNLTRIGIAGENKTRQNFEKLIKKFPEAEIIEMQGGIIPKYNPETKIQQGNTYLVGDAATQVKATTGGGIIPGMISAEKLAKSIIEKKDYKTLLKPVEKELRISLMIRKTLNNFTEKDYNRLVETLNKESVQKILSENDRDNPSKIVFKVLLSQPRLLLFTRRLLS